MAERRKDPTPDQRVRLQRFLADAGVASRRHAEDFIRAGRVLVNDEIVDELPAFIDPEHDRVRFDGRVVKPEPLTYLVLNKPPGVVCTNRDPAGRPRAVDLVPDGLPRVFPVGRLDADSTGLLLLTNDGELAAQVTHPRYGLPKVYLVEVRGSAPDNLPALMKKGVHLAEGRVSASDVRIDFRARDRSGLRLTLREGRNRQVRRMLARLGHKVRRLIRAEIGPLNLKGLPIGACRRLTARELSDLRAAIRKATADPKAAPAARRPRKTGKRPPADQPRRGPAPGQPPRPRRRIVD